MTEISFIDELIKKASLQDKTIVLPEGSDARVFDAANSITEKKIAKIILLGNEAKIKAYFDEKKYSTLNEIQVIDPETSPLLAKYSGLFYELRKDKGVTEEQATATCKQTTYFATMMVKAGDADGLVSGAIHSTADTVRPALQIVKSAKKGYNVSSFFIMVCGGTPYIFSDCGLVEDPSAEELANIAMQSALSAISMGIPPKVAMLSYSTNGSAKSHLVSKVQEATAIAKKKAAEEFAEFNIEVDGEMQLDAAIVPEVASAKFPGSTVAGQARVLIFPDLNAGNIGYKLVQRLGGAEAYGPVLQGLNAPVNDLSRGCVADDIVGVTAITVLQAASK